MDEIIEIIKCILRGTGEVTKELGKTIDGVGEDIEKDFYNEDKKGKKRKKDEIDLSEKKNPWRFFWTRLLALLLVASEIFIVVMIVMYFVAPETCKSILGNIWDFIKSVCSSIGDFISNIISKIKN